MGPRCSSRSRVRKRSRPPAKEQRAHTPQGTRRSATSPTISLKSNASILCGLAPVPRALAFSGCSEGGGSMSESTEGAGPALAAHSKDASTPGQNPASGATGEARPLQQGGANTRRNAASFTCASTRTLAPLDSMISIRPSSSAVGEVGGVANGTNSGSAGVVASGCGGPATTSTRTKRGFVPAITPSAPHSSCWRHV